MSQPIGQIAWKRRLKSRLFHGFCWLMMVLGILVLGSVLYKLVAAGTDALSWQLFVTDTREYGLRNAIVGSVMLTAGAVIIATPLAILAATFFVEYPRYSRLINILRFVNDMLLSAPSVVIGLFVYTLIVAHTTFSAYAGMIALAIIALPMITRTSEDVLYLVSPMLKEAAMALGIPKWRVIVSLVYRSARTGLITGVVLATARIMGESAPLLFTSAKNSFLNLDPAAATESLPVMIFENAMQPYPQMQQTAWTAALLITVLVLCMNLGTRWLTRNRQQDQ